MYKNIIPDGTRDLTNEECMRKSKIINSINKVFDLWGYKEVMTPSIEFYESFRYEHSGIKEENVYKFFDSKGRILALRPDMTIPIVRLVSTRFKNMNSAIKLRYCANIYKVFEEFSGKRNEYTDCGIEFISKEKEFSDLEALIIAIDSLKSIGISNFKIEIGEINFLKSAIEDLCISEEEKTTLARLIEKKEIESLNKFLNTINIDESIKKFFLNLPLTFGSGLGVLSKYKEMSFNCKMLNSVRYLEKLAEDLRVIGYDKYLSFDLGLTPRLSFYTGIIFRGFMEGSGNIVLSGGRYDNLIGNVKKDFGAIGFSINVDELESILDNNLEKKLKYNIIFNESNKIEAIKKGFELREKGFVVELIPSKDEENINIIEEEYYGY